jgi:glycosyltransferase involved in cell wall biosynthesis
MFIYLSVRKISVKMRISIVMPAYNEEKRIGGTLKEYSNFFENLRVEEGVEYEIFIVINNTKDRTKEIVEGFKKDNGNIRYLDLVKGGKGYAVTEGFKDALRRQNDLIGFVDSDMATSPKEYWKLARNIGNNDGAIANRYINGSEVYPPNTFRRLVVSRIFNVLVRSLFFMNTRDTQCGAKIFKRSAVEKVLPELKFSLWAFDVDLLYNLKKLGLKIKSVPTVWVDKEYSKINFMKAGPWMALGVIRLRLINSPFVGFARFYDFLLNKLKKNKL